MADQPPTTICNCLQPGLGGDCDGSCQHPPPSLEWRRIAEQRKQEVRRLQGIIIATVEEVQRIEAMAAKLESEGR